MLTTNCCPTSTKPTRMHRFDWARLLGTIIFILCTLVIFFLFICFCFRQRHRNRIRTQINPIGPIQRHRPPVHSSESAPPPYHSHSETPPPPPYNSKMELNL